MSSCLALGMMVTNKYLNFQSYTSKGTGYKWAGIKKKLTEMNFYVEKGANFVKIQDKSYVLFCGSGLMVTYKYVKSQSNTWKGIQNNWGSTKMLTEILCRKRDIILSILIHMILSKFKTELWPLAWKCGWWSLTNI